MNANIGGVSALRWNRSLVRNLGRQIRKPGSRFLPTGRAGVSAQNSLSVLATAALAVYLSLFASTADADQRENMRQQCQQNADYYNSVYQPNWYYECIDSGIVFIDYRYDGLGEQYPFSFNGYFRLQATYVPTGQQSTIGDLYGYHYPVSVQRNSSCGLGNPISPSTAVKCQTETIIPASAGFGLTLRYRSRPSSTDLSNPFWRTPFGARWVDDFGHRLARLPGEGDSVVAIRPDGRRVIYWAQAGSTLYKSQPDVVDRLEKTIDTTGVIVGWTYTTADHTVEQYDAGGSPIAITHRGGQSHHFTYSDGTSAGARGGTYLDTGSALPAGLLMRVSDRSGRQLTYSYYSNDRVARVTDAAGAAHGFSYDASGNLVRISFPDGTTRQFLYNEPAYTGGASLSEALTGVIDESGQRFATFTYDSLGRAVSSEHAGSVDRHTVSSYANQWGTGGIYGTAVVTDPLGTARTYRFDSKHGVARPTSLSQPCPSCGLIEAAVQSFDSLGNLTAKTDFNGNRTNYVYDTTRNLEIQRTEGLTPTGANTPNTRTITTQWHSIFRLPVSVSTPTTTTSYTYDSAGNQLTKTVTDTTVVPSVSRVWAYTYNTRGQPLSVDGPRTDVNDVTTYTYYECTHGYECGRIKTIANALGHTTTYNSYNAHGQPLTITGPTGVVTTLTYDARQRLTSRTTHSEATTLEYYPTGLLKKVTLPGGSFLEYIYDAAHRLTEVHDDLGNRVVYQLDAIGNRVAEISYDPSNALARTHSWVFDSLNRLWKDIDAPGTADVTTVFGYDANGNQSTIDAPLGRSTLKYYDQLNRIKEVKDPSGGSTHYSYNSNDNLTSITDPRGLVTTYAYTGFGQLREQVSPDTGRAVSTFDPAGNLITTTDARSKTKTYTRDALNRVTRIEYGDQTIVFEYDQGTNAVGQLTRAADSAHSLTFSYDSLGKVSSKTQTIGNAGKSLSYSYTNGNLVSLITPSGQSVSYGYTSGRISSVSVNGTTVVADVLYEPFGPVRQWTWGNGILSVRTRDQDGNVLQVDNGTLLTYGYDAANRIISVTDSESSTLSWTYSYDLMDRLLGASRQNESFGWTYDRNGNRLAQTGSGAASFNVAASSNRLSSVSGALSRTYSYDAVGNTLSYADLSFSYDDAGRMRSAQRARLTANYTYDAFGRLIQTQRPRKETITFVYDEAGRLVGEYDSSGVLIQETVWLGDIPVATLRPATGGVAIYYVHADHLNTPRRITRPSDNVAVWRWDSNPFGQGTPNENPSGAGTFSYNLRFPGQYYDSFTGLHYNLARHYDSAIGRYVQSDPIGLNGGINTYAYVNSDPLNKSDPVGLAPELRPYLATDNITCCVNGQIKICLNDPDNKDYKCAVVHESMEVHENVHADEIRRKAPTICAQTTGRHALAFTEFTEWQASELTAFNTQLDFLAKKKRQACMSPDCEAEISFLINHILTIAIPRVISGSYGR